MPQFFIVNHRKDHQSKSRRAQQAFSRVHARTTLRWRPDDRPGRPGHRRTVTPSLGRRRHTRLPNDWTATIRYTRLPSQLARSFRRLQFAALPAGDYSPSLRSPGSQRWLQSDYPKMADSTCLQLGGEWPVTLRPGHSHSQVGDE